jgi:hypothetical protein
VVLTHANGKKYAPGRRSLPLGFDGTVAPYTAKGVAGGAEHAMASSERSDDCDACHAESGSNGAPGRIVPP